MIIESLGFVEVRGAANAIAVADAMLKASNVRVLSESRLDPGQMTVIVEGDLGACQAAIEVGAEVARRNNCLVGVLLKGKPDPAIEALFYGGNGSAPPPVTPQNTPRPRRASCAVADPDIIDSAGNPERVEGEGGPESADDADPIEPIEPIQPSAESVPVPKRPFSSADVLAFITTADGGTTVAEVARAFNVGVKAARRWVGELVDQEKVERFNRGVRAREPD